MVCLRDGQTVEAFGKGNIHLTMILERLLCMMLCMFLIELFSVKRGNVVKQGGKNGTLYGMGTVSDKLYYLDCHSTVQDHAAIASQSKSGNIDLWHQRLEHFNE